MALLLMTAGLATASEHPVTFNLLPLAFQKDPQIPMSVITEVTPEGKKVVPATPAKPVYYAPWDSGVLQGGDNFAGERPPAIDALGAAMAKALAINGYLPADSTHKPTLFIYYRWGTFNRLTPRTRTSGSASEYAQIENVIQRAAIIGGDAFAAKVAEVVYSQNPRHVRDKDYQANLPLLTAPYLYFLIAFAYDMDATLHHQEKLLWTTKMSTSANGVSMAETLPVLLSNAAPYFGREMTAAQPLRVHIRQGKVTAGPETVEGYITPDTKPQK